MNTRTQTAAGTLLTATRQLALRLSDRVINHGVIAGRVACRCGVPAAGRGRFAKGRHHAS